MLWRWSAISQCRSRRLADRSALQVDCLARESFQVVELRFGLTVAGEACQVAIGITGEIGVVTEKIWSLLQPLDRHQ